MTINETREIVLAYFENDCSILEHRHDQFLVANSYRIKPDDAFYYPEQILLFEYENNKRPVESISKYFWLFKMTNWLNEGLKIKLLLTINNPNINRIRTESTQILGDELKRQFPESFDFYFLDHTDLNEDNLINVLQIMSRV